MIYSFTAAGVLSLLASVSADVYMHNPRGSNDRNCERNVNRNNGNRVFDSQNNAKGGYACPRAVGGPEMQNEMGQAKFYDVDSTTGQNIEFTQEKRVYYYEGSILPIEWTNQHGCGSNSKTSCEIVLQYACEDTLDPKVDNFWPWVQNKAEAGTTYFGEQHFRSADGEHIAAPRDGIPRDSDDAATETIPDNEDSAIASTVETRRFGMHESYDQYQLCQRTERNMGLYTADQRLRRNDRRGTRQNPNGNRNGLECPEERDYYPWWAPSPWVDIAVLTDNAKEDEVCSYSNQAGCSERCSFYLANTMNYNKKGYCDVDHADPAATVDTKLNHQKWSQRRWFNNEEACLENDFTWYEVSHEDNLVLDRDSFVCAKTQFSRVNQLGNAHADDTLQSQSSGITADHNVIHGVNANRFLWEVPTIPGMRSADYFSDMTSAYKSCSMRIRYNISTADFQQWPEDANDADAEPMVDSRNNSKSSDDTNSPLLQDPYIYMGAGDLEGQVDKFVSLAVNTNQYGRTFQDRSFSFSIKPFPAADESTALNTQTDTPPVDAARMTTSINTNSGKLYNVNVRGKRGNIVQTYPSVEYDFVPNALALDTNDMIHFQWTGSDYNPRRGCNNGEGGPPDANDFVSSANTNKNSRADRSNIVMLDSMAQNVPKDYIGYDADTSTLSYAEKIELSKTTLLANAPCYDAATDDATTRDECYAMLMRLAYLNQQLDGGALLVRDGRQCLTEEELDAMSSREQAQNHPLNCAKMNAKPFPYFDGGIMWLSKQGWFPFFSSRNNNFSNRDQSGILCVGTCPVDSVTGVLQDQNPATSGAAVSRVSATVCVDTISNGDGANNNGATSCIEDDGEDSILTGESFFNQEGDNDSKGDGNEQGCEVLSFSLSDVNTIEEKVTLAIVLLFVGLFTAWLAYFCYNRYQLSHASEGLHRKDTKWTKTSENEVL